MNRRSTFLFFISFLILDLQSVFAMSPMSRFLTTCAYATAGGAVLGLATLAVSENPGGKMNNVARGASLGLYAGIGYGFYELNKKDNSSMEVDVSENQIFITPIAENRKLDGAQINWISLKF